MHTLLRSNFHLSDRHGIYHRNQTIYNFMDMKFERIFTFYFLLIVKLNTSFTKPLLLFKDYNFVLSKFTARSAKLCLSLLHGQLLNSFK